MGLSGSVAGKRLTFVKNISLYYERKFILRRSIFPAMEVSLEVAISELLSTASAA